MKLDKHLHIVCLDVPYPVNYGGVFDLFYKITALHSEGVKIHLHCFTSGRGEKKELNKYCTEVIYYKRKTGLQNFSFSLPYIVNSRRSEELLNNLLKNNYPVLLEGIHCTYLVHQNKLLNRKVFVRLHNVESEYYNQLAKSETSLLKKIYFLHESNLLKKYEKRISQKATFIAVTARDKEIFTTEFTANNTLYLPVFLPYTSITSKQGKGNYCLYHGNLEIAENEKAVKWLCKNVFNNLLIPFVIAGKNPSNKLRRMIHNNTNMCLISTPSKREMTELINEAQIHILPSFNSTGIKIKLLNAVFNGRHCIVNTAAIEGTGLQETCCIADNSSSFKKSISDLYNIEFTNEEIQKREKLLSGIYNNTSNAKQLIQWIY